MIHIKEEQLWVLSNGVIFTSNKKEFNYEMGIRVAQLRTGKKYTREKLAEIAGFSARFLYDIESGRKGCSAEHLLGLSKALDVSSDYLLKGKQDSSQDWIIGVVAQLSTLPSDSVPYVQRLITNFVEYAQKKK